MENTFQYTPTPWKKEGSYLYAGGGLRAENAKQIAMVNSNNSQSKANGALLLASPDLLEALQRAHTCIKHARNWRKNTDPDYTDNGIYRKVSEEIDALLHAIHTNLTAA